MTSANASPHDVLASFARENQDCGHPQLKSFLQFKEGFDFKQDFIKAEFFNVSLSDQWHERDGLTEDQVQQMINRFAVVDKSVCKDGRVDMYECKSGFSVPVHQPGLQAQGENVEHQGSIFFCRKHDDEPLIPGMPDTYLVIICSAKQQVLYSPERFEAKVQDEKPACLADVRNEEIEGSRLRILWKILLGTVLSSERFDTMFGDMYGVSSKSEERARSKVTGWLALEQSKLHADMTVGCALHNGLVKRKLICNSAEILPVALDHL